MADHNVKVRLIVEVDDTVIFDNETETFARDYTDPGYGSYWQVGDSTMFHLEPAVASFIDGWMCSMDDRKYTEPGELERTLYGARMQAEIAEVFNSTLDPSALS